MHMRSNISGIPKLLGAFLLLSLSLSACSPSKPFTLIISNPIDLQRINEGVTVSLDKAPAWARKSDLILLDQAGKEIPHQRDDLNGDGEPDELYFQVSLAPKESLPVQVINGKSKKSKDSPFRVSVKQTMLQVDTPTFLFKTTGPDDLQFFTASATTALLSAAYSTPQLISKETQQRVLSQGPLRVVLEQKTLWRTKDEVLVINHRFSFALRDPLLRSTVQKVRWPQAPDSAPFSLEVESANYRLKSFATRWLLEGANAKTVFPMAAVIYRAGNLVQPKSLAVLKDRWSQGFRAESSKVSTAIMVGEINSQTRVSPNNWDRQVERAQQRWLNPIEVLVAN